MGAATANLEDVARLIQLAVVPIFLLTAVSTTLVVLMGRLSRVVDRGRSLENPTAPGRAPQREEMVRLERRAHIIYRAIFLGVTAAILVCILMTFAFMGEILRFNPARAVAGLFIAALIAYTGALMCLLREVFIALGSFRLGIQTSPTS